MTEHAQTLSRFIVVGANHRSSSLAIREKLVVEEAVLPRLLEKLKAAGLVQAVAISTGDRIEVLIFGDSLAQAEKIVTDALADLSGLEHRDLQGQLFAFSGEGAICHSFAMAATIDGILLGDPRVSESIRTGERLARDAGMIGAELDGLLASVFSVVERVNRESGIAARPVSNATAALQVARDMFGELSRISCLMVGADEMGFLLGRYFYEAGIGAMSITGGSATRLEEVAQALSADVVPLEDLDESLADADIVIAAIGSKGRLVTESLVERVLKARKRKPMILIDTAVPGNVERGVGRLEGAFVYDLNDLEQMVMDGRAESELAAQTAHIIVEAGIRAFLAGGNLFAGGDGDEGINDYFSRLGDEVMSRIEEEFSAGETRESARRTADLLVEKLLADGRVVLRRSDRDEGEEHSVRSFLRRLSGFSRFGARRKN